MTSTIPFQFWVQQFASIILRCVWQHSMRSLDPIYPISRDIMPLISPCSYRMIHCFPSPLTLACSRSKTEHPNSHYPVQQEFAAFDSFGLVEPCSNLQHGSTSITNQFGFISTQWTIGRFEQPPKTAPSKDVRGACNQCSTWTALWHFFLRGAFKTYRLHLPELFVLPSKITVSPRLGKFHQTPDWNRCCSSG